MTVVHMVTMEECAASMNRFIDWLYEVGPNSDTVTREELVRQYHAYLEDRQKAQSAPVVSLAEARAKRHQPRVTPIR